MGHTGDCCSVLVMKQTPSSKIQHVPRDYCEEKGDTATQPYWSGYLTYNLWLKVNKVVELFYQIWLITNMYWGCFMLENTVKLSALTKWHDTHIKMTLFLFDGLGIHVILGGTESTQDRLIRLANCITHKRSSGRCPSFIFPLIMLRDICSFTFYHLFKIIWFFSLKRMSTNNRCVLSLIQ